MTSISRQIARRQARKNGVPFRVKPQPTILLEDGGYKTLRPTKGWIKFSGKRVQT